VPAAGVGTNPFDHVKSAQAWHFQVQQEQVRERKSVSIIKWLASFKIFNGLLAIRYEMKPGWRARL
jgi:hypothetical protein